MSESGWNLDLPNIVPGPAGNGAGCPRLENIDWGELARSESFVAMIESGAIQVPDELMQGIAQIARTLGPLHSMGCGGVHPWGLRVVDGRTRLAIAPDYGPQARHWGEGICSPETDDRIERDLFLIAVLLFRGGLGFWPRSAADALERLALTGGELALGYDTVIRYCLDRSNHRRATGTKGLLGLIDAFAPEVSNGTESFEWVCAGDTLAGVRKAVSNPAENNEDRLVFVKRDDGSVCAAVIDGVTGDQDGSGGEAAQLVADALREFWAQPHDQEPRDWGSTALGAAAYALRCKSAPGAVALAMVQVTTSGRCVLHGVGDCIAYLVRSTPVGWCASRLLREDSHAAEIARTPDHPEEPETGVLLNWLDSENTEYDVWDHQASDGDLLLLATDGISGHDDLAFAERLENVVAAQFGQPGGIVAELLRESLARGGEDNATAIAFAFTENPGDQRCKSSEI